MVSNQATEVSEMKNDELNHDYFLVYVADLLARVKLKPGQNDDSDTEYDHGRRKSLRGLMMAKNSRL